MNRDYRRAALVASIVAAAFAVAALAADRAGCTLQGYIGVGLAGVAYGVAVQHAALNDRQERVFAAQGGVE